MSSTRENGSSDLISIEGLSKKFTKKAELHEKIADLSALVAAQEVSLKKLQDLVVVKDKEIEHLKELLKKTLPKLEAEKILPSIEETIADLQLQKLNEKALGRQFTLEEARMFEIFTKVKTNSNKTADIEPRYSKSLDNKNKKELLRIAQAAIVEEPSDVE